MSTPGLPGEAYLFFAGKPLLIPLFEALAARIQAKFPDAALRVQKSTLSWLDPTPFCYVSIRNKHALMLSVHFFARLDSPRVFAATEPYPNRWTHHIIFSSPEEIDDELMELIALSHDFRRSLKGRTGRTTE